MVHAHPQPNREGRIGYLSIHGVEGGAFRRRLSDPSNTPSTLGMSDLLRVESVENPPAFASRHGQGPHRGLVSGRIGCLTPVSSIPLLPLVLTIQSGPKLHGPRRTEATKGTPMSSTPCCRMSHVSHTSCMSHITQQSHMSWLSRVIRVATGRPSADNATAPGTSCALPDPPARLYTLDPSNQRLAAHGSGGDG